MNAYEHQRKKSKVVIAMNVLLTFTVIQLTSTWCNSAVEKRDTAMHLREVWKHRMK
jgi:hypothetical protein